LEAELRNKTEVLAEVLGELVRTKRQRESLERAERGVGSLTILVRQCRPPDRFHQSALCVHRDQRAALGGLDRTLPLQVLPVEESPMAKTKTIPLISAT
jgi:hypothetical protein